MYLLTVLKEMTSSTVMMAEGSGGDVSPYILRVMRNSKTLDILSTLAGSVQVFIDNVLCSLCIRLQSPGLESLTAGLQSLRLASRLKPWLRTIDGLGWLMAASHGLRVPTRKLTAAN